MGAGRWAGGLISLVDWSEAGNLHLGFALCFFLVFFLYWGDYSVSREVISCSFFAQWFVVL